MECDTCGSDGEVIDTDMDDDYIIARFVCFNVECTHFDVGYNKVYKRDRS